MSLPGFRDRRPYTPPGYKNAKDFVRMHFGDFGAKMEEICRMFDGQDFIVNDVKQRVEEATTSYFGYDSFDSLGTSIRIHANLRGRVFNSSCPTYVERPYFKNSPQRHIVIQWTHEYLACIFPERYENNSEPILLRVVPEPEEQLPNEPTVAVKTRMNAGTKLTQEFIEAIKLLSLCPMISLDGKACAHVPQDFPLDPESCEVFFALMSDEGVLNAVGNNERGVIWQVNRIAYHAFAHIHHIDLADVVVTDLDGARVMHEVVKCIKDLNDTDRKVDTEKLLIAELDDEETKLRARITEIEMARTAKRENIARFELTRDQLLVSKQELDAARDAIGVRKKNYLEARGIIDTMSTSDREHLFSKFQK